MLLRISLEQRQLMAQRSPHDAYQLLLSVFKQVEMRVPARRQNTWLEKAGGLSDSGPTKPEARKLNAGDAFAAALLPVKLKAKQSADASKSENSPGRQAPQGRVRRGSVSAGTNVKISNRDSPLLNLARTAATGNPPHAASAWTPTSPTFVF